MVKKMLKFSPVHTCLMGYVYMLKKKEYELQRLEINELFTQLPYTHSSSLNFKSCCFLYN